MVLMVELSSVGETALATWIHLRDKRCFLPVLEKHTRVPNRKVNSAPVLILPRLRITINVTEKRFSPMSESLGFKEQAAAIGAALKYN